MPRQLQDRHLLDRLSERSTAASKAPSTSANHKPGNQYRLFLIASGFGMNVKLVGSFKPNPETGQLTVLLRKPAPGSLRRLPAAPLLRRTGADGDPDRLHDLHGQRRLLPLGRGAARPGLDPGLRPRTRAPRYANARARFAPSTRPWKRAPPTPTPAPSSSFTLKLNREDGDQYLGKLNFTMPPGLTANLHGVTYCPEADILDSGRNPGQSRAGRPELPGIELEIGTSNVAAGPGLPPLPRGRQDLHGRALPGRAAIAWWRSPRPSPAPMTTAPWWSASPCISTPPTPT